MRILLLSFKDHEGAGSYVLNILNDLKRRNIEAKLLVSQKKSNHKDVFVLKTEPFIHKLIRKTENRLAFYPKKYDFHNRGRYILEESDLINVRKEFNFDKIILFWTSQLISAKSITNFSKRTSVELLLWPMDKAFLFGGCHFNIDCNNHIKNCHNCPAVPAYARQIPPINFIDNQTLINNSRLITHSLWFNNYLISLFPWKKPLFYFSEAQSITKMDLSIKKVYNDKEVQILYASTNFKDERKGYQLFEQIISNLDNKICPGKKITLVTIGNGVPKLSLKRIEHFDYGYIESKKRLYQIYNESDIIISTSLDDIGPSILFEAFQNGCIPISFDIGVAKEIIEDNKNGFLIPKYNVELFQEKLEILINLSLNERKKFKTASYSILENLLNELSEKNDFFKRL